MVLTVFIEPEITLVVAERQGLFLCARAQEVLIIRSITEKNEDVLQREKYVKIQESRASRITNTLPKEP